jgi:hypothetical protein
MNLHTICAWCQEILLEGDRSKPISHGICEKCSADFLSSIPTKPKNEAMEIVKDLTKQKTCYI